MSLSSYNNYLAENYLIGEDIEPSSVFNIITYNINIYKYICKNIYKVLAALSQYRFFCGGQAVFYCLLKVCQDSVNMGQFC